MVSRVTFFLGLFHEPDHPRAQCFWEKGGEWASALARRQCGAFWLFSYNLLHNSGRGELLASLERKETETQGSEVIGPGDSAADWQSWDSPAWALSVVVCKLPSLYKWALMIHLKKIPPTFRSTKLWMTFLPDVWRESQDHSQKWLEWALRVGLELQAGVCHPASGLYAVQPKELRMSP